MYKCNPKTKGSGIICAIPQKGTCPNKCEDCFFQSGRSYLEPLEENLPNMPDWSNQKLYRRIVRVNDGNDSNVQQEETIKATETYPFKFYNTSIPKDLDKFDAPVVLTINPGKMTDEKFYDFDYFPIPKNLMFVRFRTNTWNLELLDRAVGYYSSREIPIVLTFMAYFTLFVRPGYEKDYILRKRTLNTYWAITTEAWESVMVRHKYNKWVYSCGKIEGEKGTSSCARCGNCIREYFVTMERMNERKE